MVKIFYLFIIFNFLIADDEINKIFIEANNHFINQKYNEAIEKYEKIIESGYDNSTIFYNLGNAYFRNNNLGHSIWAYLNSLRLNPRNEDANYNLLIAQSRTKGQIKMPKILFFLDLYRHFKSSFTLDELILFTSFLFLIFSFITLLLKLQIIKNSYFYLFNKILLSIVIIINIVGVDIYLQLKNDKKGVVISKNIDAYSGPEYGQNIIIFRLNEGMIFEINKINNDWLEIIIADGQKGWVPINSVRII